MRYLFKCTHLSAQTNDIAAFTLEPLHCHVDFIPGQFVEIKAPHLPPMPVSIANTPNAKGLLQFQLRCDEKHPNARHLIAHLKQHVVELSPAQGHCILPPVNNRNALLLLAGGTGLAPYLSLLMHALEEQKRTNPIHLLWGIKAIDDLRVTDRLESWAARYPHFRFSLIHSRPHHENWTGLSGWLHDYLPALLSPTSLPNVSLYACGPYAMVKKCYHQALALKLPPEQFFSDVVRSGS